MNTTDKEDEGSLILLLNDDCLYNIFTYLDFWELAIIAENVCVRFKTVAQMIYKTCKVMDWDQIMDNILKRNKSCTQAFRQQYCDDYRYFGDIRQIISRVGNYIHTLKMDASDWHKDDINLISLYCKNLQKISLKHLPRFDIDTFFKLAPVFKNVTEAELKDCWYLGDEKLMLLLRLDQLKVLKCDFETTGKMFAELRGMKKIEFSTSDQFDTSLFKQFCETNPELTSLDISACTHLNNDCIEAIVTNFRKLEKLVIFPHNFINISNETWNRLADIPSITHLKIHYWPKNDEPEHEFLKRICAHNRLQHLEIISRELTEESARAISLLTKLRVLKLMHIKKCYDYNMLDAVRCTVTLQELHIHTSDVCISEASLERLIQRYYKIKFIAICSFQIRPSFFVIFWVGDLGWSFLTVTSSLTFWSNLIVVTVE